MGARPGRHAGRPQAVSSSAAAVAVIVLNGRMHGQADAGLPDLDFAGDALVVEVGFGGRTPEDVVGPVAGRRAPGDEVGPAGLAPRDDNATGGVDRMAGTDRGRRRR